MKRTTKKIRSFLAHSLTETGFKIYNFAEKIYPSDYLTDEEIDKGNIITFFGGIFYRLGNHFYKSDDLFGSIQDNTQLVDHFYNLIEDVNEKIKKNGITIKEIWENTGLSKRTIKKLDKFNYTIKLWDLMLIMDYIKFKIKEDENDKS